MVNFCRTKLIDKKLKEALSDSTNNIQLKEDIKQIEKKPYVPLDLIVGVSKELKIPLNELLEKSSIYVEPVEVKKVCYLMFFFF